MTTDRTIGRREEDMTGHCNRHEQHTEEIAGMKSSVSLLKWAVSAGLPLVLVVAGALVSPYLQAIDRIQTAIIRVESTIHTGAIADSVLRSEIDAIRRDVDELKGQRSHR